MKERRDHPVTDRPWRGRGALRCAVEQVRLMLHPPVAVFEPPPGSLTIERDVPVVVRDGTTLRVNVYRPATEAPVPVILSAHPYGKDKLPRKRRRGAHLGFQFHAMRQTGPVSISTLTSWEAPDPAWWVRHGYAVVNADLRGAGTSEGTGSLLSDLEATDVYDLIEWAGSQPWSSGRVGLLGVSYLAISQYKAAALRPPHLAAMCPWEGTTDIYRDLVYPGGIAERGFFRIWSAGARRTVRLSTDLGAAQREHPLRDGFWESLAPELDKIETPMLVCASFSDNNVHSRGSFRAFERAGSPDRFAFTHRAGKWTTFYSEQASQVQREFLDRYLRDPPPSGDRPPLPPVRLEVREDRRTVVAVRDECEWPLARTRWLPLHLAADGVLAEQIPTREELLRIEPRRRAAAFTHTFAHDTEVTGPMSARLWIQVHDAEDVDLFVGVEKWRGGRFVGFEGSYGFPRDRVATGWLRASLRELDDGRSIPGRPVHTLRCPQPLAADVIVPVDIALGPSATLFRAGESLRLVIAGRWLWPVNPLTGQFPARYARGPRTRLSLHWSPERPAHLLVPTIPEPLRGAAD